jgi:DNA-binding transcriptional ArsR family regulator
MSRGKYSPPVCEEFSCSEEKIKSLQAEVAAAGSLGRIFRALGDETRLKMACALSKEELCVCDLATLAGCSVASASHHLRLMYGLGLVNCRKEGKFAYYNLADKCITEIIETAMNHVKEGHHVR